jgi:predicted transcriptional regulator
VKRKPKYERILKLVKDRQVVTLKKCQKRYPDISTTTFQNIMNLLTKSGLLTKTSLSKRNIVYRKTSKYSIEKAKECLKKHVQAESGMGNAAEKNGRGIPVNPLLTMAMYSLWNALESFHAGDERRRQAAIILMDLAVEYALKAKICHNDPVKFVFDLEHLNFSSTLKELKRGGSLSKEDEAKIVKVHNTRNRAQHRGAIPDLPSTRQLATWTRDFLRSFVSKNFNTNLSDQIPINLLEEI